MKKGKSYIKSPEWLEHKRATINPQNRNDSCFQYAITVALNHQNIENHPERISNIELFINQYHWKDIDFPSHHKDWNKIIRELLLIYYLYNTIQKKYGLHTNQNITASVIIK